MGLKTGIKFFVIIYWDVKIKKEAALFMQPHFSMTKSLLLFFP